jgi:hypothetical protein
VVDFDGDGDDLPGVYDPSTGTFYILLDHEGRFTTIEGGPVDGMDRIPIAGDWDGDGRDDVGLYTPGTGVFWLFDRSVGAVIADFGILGPHRGVPIVGDWDQDGVDTVGLFIVDDNEFLLAERNIEGGGNYASFHYDPPGQTPIPLAGDWNGPVYGETGERGRMSGPRLRPRGAPSTVGSGARISAQIPTGQSPLFPGRSPVSGPKPSRLGGGPLLTPALVDAVFSGTEADGRSGVFDSTVDLESQLVLDDGQPPASRGERAPKPIRHRVQPASQASSTPVKTVDRPGVLEELCCELPGAFETGTTGSMMSQDRDDRMPSRLSGPVLTAVMDAVFARK